MELESVAAAVAAAAVAGVTGNFVAAVAADGDVDLSAVYVVVGVCAYRTRWRRAGDLQTHDGRLDFCLGVAFVLDRPAAAIDEFDTGPEPLLGCLVSAAAAGWDEGEAPVSWEER